MSRQHRQFQPNSSWQEPRFMLCFYHIEIQQYQKGKKRKTNPWDFNESFCHQTIHGNVGSAEIVSVDLCFPSEYRALHPVVQQNFCPASSSRLSMVSCSHWFLTKLYWASSERQLCAGGLRVLSGWRNCPSVGTESSLVPRTTKF